MTTDNELIKFWPKSEMASGSHFVIAIHIFVTLCPIYESLVITYFLCYTYVCSMVRSSSSEIWVYTWNRCTCKGAQDPLPPNDIFYILLKDPSQIALRHCTEVQFRYGRNTCVGVNMVHKAKKGQQ